MRRFILVTLLATLCTGPALAYTIVLKDGSTIIARQKYQVEGKRAIITLQNGTRTFLALQEIDVERTDRLNENNYGSAVVLENSGEITQERITPEPPKKSITDVASASRSTLTRPPARRQGSRANKGSSSLRTASGNLDLSKLPSSDFGDPEVTQLIRSHFASRNISNVQILKGSRSGRLLLAVNTNSEGEVFRSLALAATALELIQQQHAGSVSAIELLMTTSDGGQAGQFLLTPKNIRPLLDGDIEVPQFYVDHVQF
jgi:hypothetical protein